MTIPGMPWILPSRVHPLTLTTSKKSPESSLPSLPTIYFARSMWMCLKIKGYQKMPREGKWIIGIPEDSLRSRKFQVPTLVEVPWVIGVNPMSSILDGDFPWNHPSIGYHMTMDEFPGWKPPLKHGISRCHAMFDETEGYPLVNKHNYRKSPFLVDMSIKPSDFP